MNGYKFLTLTLLLPFFFFSTPADAINLPVGSAAPDFTLASLDWDRVSLSEHKGEIVALLYWKPGQDRSVPAVGDWRDIYTAYEKKGVKFFSIIPEAGNYKDVKEMVKDDRINFPVLIDKSRKVFGSYEVRVYPSTVIINREGIITYDIPGHALTYKLAIEGYLRYMLGEINEEELKEMISPSKQAVDHEAVAAERNYSMAMKFADSRLTELAINAAKKALEHKADYTDAHILLGFLYLDEREAESALEQFKMALELAPSSHDAKTGLGAALKLKGDIEGAIEILTEAARLNPYPQKAYYELGKIFESNGEKDKAAKMYRKVFEKTRGNNLLPAHISRCQ